MDLFDKCILILVLTCMVSLIYIGTQTSIKIEKKVDALQVQIENIATLKDIQTEIVNIRAALKKNP